MKTLTKLMDLQLPQRDVLEAYFSERKIKLPDKMIDFLAQQNPAYTAECYFIKADDEPYDISFFPFIESEDVWSIQKSIDNLFVDFLESKYLPFGSDSGGWQYVISVQEEDFGKVYLSRMDEALEDSLTLLSESFEEFIDALVSEDEIDW